MHQGDLPGWATKAHQAQLQPEAAGIRQAHGLPRRLLRILRINQLHSRFSAI
jgi:hypothetical protein